MTEHAFPDLPAELSARLEAAGIVDVESMEAAFAADPALRRDYEAYLAANRERILDATIGQILEAFPSVSHRLELAALWAVVPPEREAAFIAAVEGMIAAAAEAGDAEGADSLSRRLESIHELRRARQEAGAQIAGWLERLSASPDLAALAPIWNEIPPDLEEPFIRAVEERAARAAAEGEPALAERLTAHLEVMRQASSASRAYAEQPPEVRAAVEFLQAPSEAEARAVFERRRELLAGPEAQQLLDNQFRSDDADVQSHINARASLLRRLRG